MASAPTAREGDGANGASGRQRQRRERATAPTARQGNGANGATGHAISATARQGVSANGAKYDSQGQARAKRARRPWSSPTKRTLRPEGPE